MFVQVYLIVFDPQDPDYVFERRTIHPHDLWEFVRPYLHHHTQSLSGCSARKLRSECHTVGYFTCWASSLVMFSISKSVRNSGSL
jgi:hypothetical protein